MSTFILSCCKYLYKIGILKRAKRANLDLQVRKEGRTVRHTLDYVLYEVQIKIFQLNLKQEKSLTLSMSVVYITGV